MDYPIPLKEGKQSAMNDWRQSLTWLNLIMTESRHCGNPSESQAEPFLLQRQLIGTALYPILGIQYQRYARRLKLAAYGARILDMIGRAITPDFLDRSRLREFEELHHVIE